MKATTSIQFQTFRETTGLPRCVRLASEEFVRFSRVYLSRFPNGIHDERPDGTRTFSFDHPGRLEDFRAIGLATLAFQSYGFGLPLTASRWSSRDE